jgi:phage tail sheath gpL-like
MISFLSIPTDVRTPGAYLEFDASRAVQGLPASPQKILIIGQRLGTGIVAALTPTLIVGDAQAVAAFGRGSQLAAMCKALRRANSYTEAWAIGVADDGAGVAATYTVTITGPSTAAGTLALMVAGVPVRAAVTSGMTATQVATAIAAAVTALPDLPVTAGSALGVATLTARNKGTAGNDIDVRVNYYQGEAIPAGLTCAIAAGVAGATNPGMAAVFAAIGDVAYQTIVLPFTDTTTLDAVDAELESRAGPMRMIEAMAYAGYRGTVGGAAAAGSARNGKYVSILPMKLGPTPTYEVAAAYAGVIAYHGAIDPARPFQTLPLPGVLPPAIADRYTQSEREQLLRDGMSTYTVDSGGVVLIERAITTYQLNAQSLDDIAFLDVNTPLTLFYLRRAVRARILAKFPRHKLADDRTNFAAGQAVVTPKIIRAELIVLMRDLETAGLVENLDQFIADVIVERDPNDPSRVNALIPPDIVNQFRVLAGRVEFRL